MRIGPISQKRNRKKKVPTKYKSANILLSFCPTAPEPSEINFLAQSTSKIDLMSFFQFPEHPCAEKEKCDQFDLILSLVMTAGRLEFKLSSGNPFRKRQHWLRRPPIQSYEEFVILLHNPSILFSLHLTTGAAVFSKVEGFISSFPALL